LLIDAGTNGAESAEYVEPYTPRQPGMGYTVRSRGNGRGTPRGRALFHMNGGPRGNRGGRGSPGARGFGGFRGRGPPRGGRRGRPF